MIKIDINIALIASSVSYEKKLYMIDALIYACGVHTNSEVLTGDYHFKKLDNVKFLG